MVDLAPHLAGVKLVRVKLGHNLAGVKLGVSTIAVCDRETSFYKEKSNLEPAAGEKKMRNCDREQVLVR